MGGAERVVHIHLAQIGQLGRERRIVLGFLFVEADILQQQHFAVFESHRGRFDLIAHAVAHLLHGLAQKFRQTLRYGIEVELRHALRQQFAVIIELGAA